MCISKLNKVLSSFNFEISRADHMLFPKFTIIIMFACLSVIILLLFLFSSLCLWVIEMTLYWFSCPGT